jgi:DNA-binding NarL/FixJ family response regulator
MTDKPIIVLADDNARILQMLAKLLRPCFRIVAQCQDGDAAFKAIKELSPRLGILDIAMPKINGLEVGRRLVAVHNSTKIVFLTVESDKELSTRRDAVDTDMCSKCESTPIFFLPLRLLYGVSSSPVTLRS